MISNTQSRTIIIDFDGTICENKFPGCGPPEPFVKDILEVLQADNYTISIHSASTNHNWGENNQREHYYRIRSFLEKHDIPYDNIILDEDKPIAFAYIDDRGVGYRGSWVEVLKEIRKMEQKDGK